MYRRAREREKDKRTCVKRRSGFEEVLVTLCTISLESGELFEKAVEKRCVEGKEI